MRRLAILLIAFVSATTASTAQRLEPRFDVVSIKRNTSPELGMRPQQLPGREVFENVSPDYLVQQAYSVTAQRTVNLPDWAKSERFDIVATYDPAVARSRADVIRMVQGLLKDRFSLQAHRETRDMSVYVLERLRDGELGPRLRPSSIDCASRVDGRSPCFMKIAPGMVNAIGGPWGFLTLNLGVSDRPIVDRTGVTGRVDVTLEWNATTLNGSTDPSVTGDKVSIFTALEEQLGLRLRPAREPLDVLVVDHIERPTEN